MDNIDKMNRRNFCMYHIWSNRNSTLISSDTILTINNVKSCHRIQLNSIFEINLDTIFICCLFFSEQKITVHVAILFRHPTFTLQEWLKSERQFLLLIFRLTNSINHFNSRQQQKRTIKESIVEQEQSCFSEFNRQNRSIDFKIAK